jgi:hypothetical protein
MTTRCTLRSEVADGLEDHRIKIKCLGCSTDPRSYNYEIAFIEKF